MQKTQISDRINHTTVELSVSETKAFTESLPEGQDAVAVKIAKKVGGCH